MRNWILLLLLILEIAVFTLLSGVRFDSVGHFIGYFQSYLSDLLTQSTPTLLLGFGMTLVLITAGIDLSVGSMVALIACVMASFPGDGGFWWTAVPLGLMIGLALGFLNGALIAWLDVPPIITTLGTMIFYRGLCFVVMGDLEKAPFIDVPGYEWLGLFAGALVIVVLLYLVAGPYIHHSRWLRELLMMGGNRIAARYAGIPVQRRILQVYTLMGLLGFLAAVSFTARNSSVSAGSLTGFELQVIVAVVLGGTRVQGGSGTLLGAFLGVMLIAVLEEGLRGASIWGDTYLPFEISHLEYIFLGGLLLLGVWISGIIHQRSRP